MSDFPDPVRTFFDMTRAPNKTELDALVRRGVPPLAVGTDNGFSGFCLGAANVAFYPEGLFDFAADAPDEMAVSALVVVSRDEAGDPDDLVAFRSDGTTAAWLGHAALLGAHDVLNPRMGEPLSVHPSPLAWLKAGRVGVVILDGPRARSLLECAGGPLLASDEQHGLWLQGELTARDIPIVIPNHERAAA